MTYFSRFPYMAYDITNSGNYKLLPDILRSVKTRTAVKEGRYLFDSYDVKNGETPESIAYKLYGDTTLHWVVLLVNDITDRYHQWPMSYIQFSKYVTEKYVNADGTSNVSGVHHYEVAQSSGDTDTKIEVYSNSALYTGDTDFYASATAITNYEYEESLQDEKRKIRLLDPSFIDQFVTEFKSLIKETII